MRPLFWVGLVVLVLGIAAFLVPITRQEKHGVKLDGASVSMQTTSRERLPLWVGAVLVFVGGAMMVSGARQPGRV